MDARSVTAVALALGSTVALAAASDPVTGCLRSHQCVIQVRGAGIARPAMTLVVARGVWNSWSDEERRAAKARLGREAALARKHPERYTDVPVFAPAYQRIVDATRNVRQYSIVVSDTDGRTRPLQISAEVDSGAVPAQVAAAESLPKISQGEALPTPVIVTFIVRPIIRSSLHDPSSLRDFEVLGISPVQKAPGMAEVVVGYRAKNRLGAVVYEEAKFVMAYSPTQKQWAALPVR